MCPRQSCYTMRWKKGLNWRNKSCCIRLQQENPTKDFSLVGLLLFPQNDAEHIFAKIVLCSPCQQRVSNREKIEHFTRIIILFNNK